MYFDRNKEFRDADSSKLFVHSAPPELFEIRRLVRVAYITQLKIKLSRKLKFLFTKNDDHKQELANTKHAASIKNPNFNNLNYIFHILSSQYTFCFP